LAKNPKLVPAHSNSWIFLTPTTGIISFPKCPDVLENYFLRLCLIYLSKPLTVIKPPAGWVVVYLQRDDLKWIHTANHGEFDWQ
jgi:hypothetical protein